MSMRYAAIFKTGDKEGQYCVEFPDLVGCLTYGDTLTEAFHYAQEVLSLRIECMLENGENLPVPQHYDAENIYWIPVDSSVVMKLVNEDTVNA